MLWLIGFTGYMLEGSRIVAEPRSSDGLAFIGPIFAAGFRALGAGVDTHHAIWIVHLAIVLAFLYSLTSTKLRHMFIGPVNIFFKTIGAGYESGARLTPIADFEHAETFGVEKVEEYTWKQLLDMAACLECGRCTLNCPPSEQTKALNPEAPGDRAARAPARQTRRSCGRRWRSSRPRAPASRQTNARLDEARTRGEGSDDVALDELAARSR
jgi:ferredoxin